LIYCKKLEKIRGFLGEKVGGIIGKKIGDFENVPPCDLV